MSSKAEAFKDAIKNAKRKQMGSLVITIGHDEPDEDDLMHAAEEKEEGDKDWGLTKKRGLEHPGSMNTSDIYQKKRGLRVSSNGKASRDDVIRKLLG